MKKGLPWICTCEGIVRKLDHYSFVWWFRTRITYLESQHSFSWTIYSVLYFSEWLEIGNVLRFAFAPMLKFLKGENWMSSDFPILKACRLYRMPRNKWTEKLYEISVSTWDSQIPNLGHPVSVAHVRPYLPTGHTRESKLELSTRSLTLRKNCSN